MNPLDQLQDIHLPQAVEMWPPAYGWWLLTALILLTSGYAIHYWKKRKHWLQAKKDALLELKQIDASQADWPQACNALLKRLCLSYMSPEKIADAYGDTWLHLLTQVLPVKHQAAFQAQLSPLLKSLYQAQPEPLSFEETQQQIANWIKHFKPKPSSTQPPINTLSKSEKINQRGKHHV